MNEIVIYTLALGAGILLGLVFYGGLWWTVRKGLTSTYAPLWFMASFWLRLMLALGGFYIVAQGDLKNLLLCFIGFMLGRVAVTLLTREDAHAA